MKDQYRFQSYIYDTTRIFFLFERKRAIDEMSLKPGNVAAEIGCGTGYNINTISGCIGPDGKAYGVDCSESMLRIARKKIKRRNLSNVTLINSYADKFKMPVKADSILFSYSLSMIKNWKEALENAASNLKSGGKIVIIDFHKWDRFDSLYKIWVKWLGINNVNISRGPIEFLKKYSRESQINVMRSGYIYLMRAII